MEILIAILVIALIAALAFVLMQRRAAVGGARGPGQTRAVPTDRTRAPRGDPMADAVVSHAQATDPQEVRLEEERLRAQANRVAAGLHEDNAGAMGGTIGIGADEAAMQAEAHRNAAAGHERAADDLAHDPSYADERVDDYVDPEADPRYDDAAADGYIDPAAGPRPDGRIR